MALTRTQIRRLLAQDVAGELYVLGTVAATPAPTTTAFTIAATADSGSDVGKFKDRYVFVPLAAADDQERRIKQWSINGATTVHRALSVAHTAAWAVEVHRFPPVLMHQAINDALARMTYLDMLDLTITQGLSQYDLTATYAYLTHPKDVVAVYSQGTALNSDYLRDQSWYKIYQDGTGLKMWISPTYFSTTGVQLTLQVRRPYSALSLEADTTVAPELWVRAGARVQLYKLLIGRTSPGRERTRYQQNLGDALADFRRQSKLYQPDPPRKINLAMPMTSGTSPRGSWYNP